MITVKITGGLGNQMFQYAVAKNLSIKKNTNIILDISDYYNQGLNVKRKYQLDIFNINYSKIIYRKDNYIQKIIKIIQSKIPLKFITKNKSIFKERGFTFDDSIYKIKGDITLDGYFQSEKYFIDIKDVILNNFSLRNKIEKKSINKLKKEIKQEQSVSVHIRRGDYVNDKKINKFHGIIPIKYYLDAMKRMEQLIHEPIFYIFSDDIDWCKQNLKMKSKNIVFVSGNQDYEDLEIIKNCKHHIIANSTFSWWGAWLNENEEKIVIAPKNWFKNKSINTKDLIPEKWITL